MSVSSVAVIAFALLTGRLQSEERPAGFTPYSGMDIIDGIWVSFLFYLTFYQLHISARISPALFQGYLSGTFVSSSLHAECY